MRNKLQTDIYKSLKSGYDKKESIQKGENQMEKRLYRVTEGKLVAGVCGGVAEYFNIDPTVVRVVWAITSCFAFAGIFAYIAAALIIPEKPKMIEE